MGITAFDIKLLEKYIDKYKPENVIEFGSQNLYLVSVSKHWNKETNEWEDAAAPFASEWYKSKGLEYNCVDLGGDNGAWKIDVSYPFGIGVDDRKGGYQLQFSLVTDFGFSEHVVQMEDYVPVTYDGGITSIYPKGEINIIEGYYNCWLNKHNLCKIGGLIISENPKTGNWPGHGYTYIDVEFYKELSLLTDYEDLELGIHAAMGNFKDGYNVYCVMKKNSDKFPSLEEFKTLPIFQS